MKCEQVNFFVPGIWNRPGTWNFAGRAVTHTHVATGHPAEKVEYFSSVVTRAFRNTSRAKKLARALGFYYGCPKINLTGHSNGTDVILDGLKLAGWPHVQHLHLIAGAAHADFDVNGLNYALEQFRVQRVFVYIGGKDLPLRIADTWLGRLFGYGALGKTGPINNRFAQLDLLENEPLPEGGETPEGARVIVRRFKEFGHSTFFLPKHFNQTMSYIL